MTKNSSRALVEGTDYYLEGGNLVFTGAYHLKRGHCCENGCRHCPFGYSLKAHESPGPESTPPTDPGAA